MLRMGNGDIGKVGQELSAQNRLGCLLWEQGSPSRRMAFIRCRCPTALRPPGTLQPMQRLHLPPLFLGPVDGYPEKLAEELDSLGRVIVARDRVSDEARVAVGVHNAHRGDVHLGSIPHSHMGLKDIVERVQEDDEVWQADCGPEEEMCVGQQTTLEVARVGVLSAVLGCVLDQVRELPIPAHEQDDALAVGHVSREVQGQL